MLNFIIKLLRHWTIFKYWIIAIRPKTLTISLSPVLLGGALACEHGCFYMFYFFMTAITALLIQIGTNLCNDYFDFVKGADTEERIGPIRVTQAGLISPIKIKLGFVFFFIFAAITGAILVHRCGAPIFIIGSFSLIFGFLYTAGPYALAYIGFAEIFVILFFGPIAVAGTYFIQTLDWNIITIVSGIMLGLIACSILVLNNSRDIEQDRKANKKTLAVRFGPKFANQEYIYCMVLSSTIAYYLSAIVTSITLLIVTILTERRVLNNLITQSALLMPGLTLLFIFENLLNALITDNIIYLNILI